MIVLILLIGVGKFLFDSVYTGDEPSPMIVITSTEYSYDDILSTTIITYESDHNWTLEDLQGEATT